MLLSVRSPSIDITSHSSQKPLPNILSSFRRRTSIPTNTILATNSSPGYPLETSDPPPAVQITAGEGMLPSSVAYNIGRPITTNQFADAEDTETSNGQVITLSSNVDPSLSTTKLDSSDDSLPGAKLRPPSIMSAASSTVIGSPTFNVQEVDADQNQPSDNPSYLTNGDLYSNLATFSFGSPHSASVLDDPSSSPYDADAEVSEFISPLTPMNRKSSADRTPRPSVVGHFSGKPSSSHPPQQQRQSSNQPAASTSRSRTSTAAAYLNYDDNDENEETIDLDYRPHRGRVMSDTASQHTFGGKRRRSDPTSSSSSRSRSRSSVRSGAWEFSSEDEVELDYDVAHGTYITQGGVDMEEDEEFGVGGQYMGPTSHGRRGSLPMVIPGASPDTFVEDDGSRNREDSLVTLRRPSRSLDDDLRVMNAAAAAAVGANEGMVPKSEPVGRGVWSSLEAQQQQSMQLSALPQNDALDGYDPSYILNDSGSRGSIALSYVDHNAYTVSRAQPSRQSLGFIVGGWGAGLAWSGGGRRPSTATTGTTNDDSFAANVRRFDPEYGGQSGHWLFKREKADGLGAPKRSSGAISIRSGRGGESSKSSEQEREKKRTTMAPGMQEIWRNELVGRYKVDRLALRSRSQDPAKPHQQRLNIRHIHDPYSKGNVRGGPASVVHKHSKAVAFSIFRHYGLLMKSMGTSESPMAASQRSLPGGSPAIMLAPKKVQEHYTSTRTTSKLTTHGLLGDEAKPAQNARSSAGEGRRSDVRRRTASGVDRENERKERERKEKERKEKEKERKQKEKEEKAKAKKAQLKNKNVMGSAGSSSTVNSAHDTIGTSSTTVEGKQRRHSVHQVRQVVVSNASSATATSVYNPVSTSTSSSTTKRHSSFGTSLPLSSSNSHANAAEPTKRTSDNHSDDTLLDGDSVDGDDEMPMTVSRTPHAEAFASLDPNVIEYVRSKNGNRVPVDGGVHWAKRWLPGFARPTKAITHSPAYPVGPSVAVLEANYNPPWMTIAGRSAQEINERLIQNLNDSFKDVGLVHSKPSKSNGRRKSKAGLHIFGEVPDDALYMLLPLWASETDEASKAESPGVKFDNVPVNERLYLLVYYVPFDEKDPKFQESKKKKSKSQLSPEVSLEPMDDKTIILSSFRVSARLIAYDELSGCGVRLPSTGLSVTGPVREAMHYAPPQSIHAQHHDDSVVATCMGREQGIQFIPEGLFKLGLTFPTSEMEPQVVVDLEVGLTRLSPIGRAAVEMIWLGCMALTSFGAT